MPSMPVARRVSSESLQSFEEAGYRLDHVVELGVAQAGVDTEEEGIVHHAVRAGEVAHGAEERMVAVRVRGEVRWLARQVAAEEHARLDLVLLDMAHEVAAGEGRAGAYQQEEAEPARLSARCSLGQLEEL